MSRQAWQLVAVMVMVMVVGAALGVGQAYGADKSVEFGVEDDLTILGTEGNLNDADVQVEGFAVFGPSGGLTVPAAFTNGPGSIVVASNLFVNGQFMVQGGLDMSDSSMTVSNITAAGDVAISGDSTVGGALDVTGGTTVGGDLLVNGTTASTTKDTGALVVDGGVGVEENINVGGDIGVVGDAAVGGTLDVTGAGTMEDNLTVQGNLSTWGTGLFSNTVTAVKNVRLATDAANSVGVGTASPDANTKLDVRGGSSSGDYVVKFYSGTDVAAWIRKK